MFSAKRIRLVSFIDDCRRWALLPSTRRYLLFSAAAVFFGGLVWSIRSLPGFVNLTSPWPLVKIALFGVTGRIVISALELAASANLACARLSFGDCIRASLVSSAANFLPLPGGPVVRIAALRLGGGTVARSSMITVFLGVAWLGLALCYAGLWIMSTRLPVGVPFVLLGTIAMAVSAFVMCGTSRKWRVVLALFTIKAAAIAVGLLRLNWAFVALGLSVAPGELAVFAISTVAGSVLAIFPAGIGVNEAAAAALAPLVGIDSATAFLAAALNRLVGLPIMLMAALFASLTLARRTGAVDEQR